MGVHYFSDKQVEELRRNPYVDKVSNKAITYSEVFKQHFMRELEHGSFLHKSLEKQGLIHKQ